LNNPLECLVINLVDADQSLLERRRIIRRWDELKQERGKLLSRLRVLAKEISLAQATVRESIKFPKSHVG
jgi:hypothetical protein